MSIERLALTTHDVAAAVGGERDHLTPLGWELRQNVHFEASNHHRLAQSSMELGQIARAGHVPVPTKALLRVTVSTRERPEGRPRLRVEIVQQREQLDG